MQLERARDILRRWGDDRARFEQALASCNGGFGLRSAEGALADVQFLDVRPAPAVGAAESYCR